MLNALAGHALEVLIRYACMRMHTVEKETDEDRIWQTMWEIGMDDPKFPYEFYYLAPVCVEAIEKTPTGTNWLTYTGSDATQPSIAHLHYSQVVRRIVFLRLSAYLKKIKRQHKQEVRHAA